MFETVGQSSKTDKKQQAGSFLLSLAINGGFVGGLILAGATVAEEVIEEAPVEVAFFDLAPPPPPPPAPGWRRTKEAEDREEEA